MGYSQVNNKLFRIFLKRLNDKNAGERVRFRLHKRGQFSPIARVLKGYNDGPEIINLVTKILTAIYYRHDHCCLIEILVRCNSIVASLGAT